MNALILFTGFFAGALSSTIGFGGGMVLLPVITYFFGIKAAVPICTIAQLISNASRVAIGIKQVKWRQTFWFLATAIPLIALGAYGFSIAPTSCITKFVCIGLIIFAIMKLSGKMRLPHTPTTMLVGGGLTGIINGLMSISGPLSSAVFLTLDITPVAYIASEAFAATIMHVVKIIVYGKLNLVNPLIIYNGLGLAAAMVAGNWIGMRLIGKIKNKLYQRFVAVCMILLSIWLFVEA